MTYQVVFIINFFFLFFMMKVVSWCVHPNKDRRKLFVFFLKTPYLSPASLRHKQDKHQIQPIIRLLLAAALFAIPYFIAIELSPLSYWDIIIISPSIYFLTEFLGGLGQFLFSRPYRPIISIHHSPLVSKSLGQFWGYHWNRWVQDWLKELGRAFRSRSRSRKIILAFLLSGLFHELMFNLPYYIYYQESYFGTMMLYFLIQGLGLWIEKTFIRKHHPVLRFIFLWSVVLLPSPIFINVPLLTFLGL